MSMMGWVLGVTPAQIRAFRINPDLAGEVAMAAEEGEHQIAAAPGPIEPALDLEKSWHMLHYMFTGRPDPTGNVAGSLMDGEEMGEDFGYGPARLLDEAATQAFSEFLRGLQTKDVESRLNGAQMHSDGVYAASPDDEDVREEFETYFPQLREYVSRAANKNGGLLVWIS